MRVSNVKYGKRKSLGKTMLKLIIIIFSFELLLIAFTAILVKDENEDLYYNKARIICADKLNEVRDEIKYGSYNFKKWKYPYVVIDNKGKILYGSDALKLGKSVDLNQFLQFDKSSYINNKDLIKTTFPIVIDSENKGFMVAFINKAELSNKSILEKRIYIITPFVIAALFNLIVWSFYKKYHDRNVIKPIQKITESAEDIINGTLTNYVTYESNTEIGELAYAFELMRDEIDNYRKREEKLKKAQKEMIIAISHDLKTPLSSIKAYVEAIRDGIAESDEDRHEYTGVVLKKVNDINKLTDDLLEHSKAELEVLTICKKEVFIKEFLFNIIKEIELQLKNTEIQFKYDDNIPDGIIEIDEIRISQVIFNLITNAIKYSNKNSHIEFKAKVTNKELFIYIEDNGQGILPEDTPFIFNKFYRGDKSRNSKIQGSGIGLSICKYIVEKHYGEIFFKSKINGGSIFYFYIPML